MSKADPIVNFVLNESAKDDFSIKELTSRDPAGPLDPFDLWTEKYQPIKNPFDPEAGFDGTMFETFGKELNAVRAAKPNHIWTRVTGDNNEDIISAGFHFVNRVGYFITDNPWTDGSETVQIDEGDPTDAPSAAWSFIEYGLSQNWRNQWSGMAQEQKRTAVLDYVSTYGLEDLTDQIVAEIDRLAVGGQANPQ